MPLELLAPAQLKAVSISKEGPDDDKILAVTVKIEAETDEDILATFDPTLRSALFRTDKPELRFPQMGPVSWMGEMQHMRMVVNMLSFDDVTLKKFVIEPYINAQSEKRVRLTFSAALSPTGREVAVLAEMVTDAVQLNIVPAPSLDLGTPSGAPA